jgi:hypothetical protein
MAITGMGTHLDLMAQLLWLDIPLLTPLLNLSHLQQSKGASGEVQHTSACGQK